jgi:hypothetical protein
LKRNAPKVKVGVVKRKKNSKAQVPVELLEQRPDLEKRLNTRWAAARLLVAAGTETVYAQSALTRQVHDMHRYMAANKLLSSLIGQACCTQSLVGKA